MRVESASALALLLIAVALPPVAEADRPPDAACGDRAAAALQRRYESARDLRADIVQTTQSVALGSGASAQMVSRGTVILAKPGKMRWSYAEPEPSLVVSDGKTLWIYDPEFHEVQKFPVTEGFMSGAAVEFLLGEGNLLRDFDVLALSCDEKTVELRLLPRKTSSYEKLHVLVDPKTGDLLRTTVFFVLGNVTEVEFSGIQLNLDPAIGLFRMEPPPGARVIELDEQPQ